MFLIQFINNNSNTQCGIVNNELVTPINKFTSTYELFMYTEAYNKPLINVIKKFLSNTVEDYNTLHQQKRILVPLHHPDAYHTWITGTGLTHLGSAASRNAMHKKIAKTKETEPTDSMKMFEIGLNDGKMVNNVPAAQPEWFYKGNGLIAVNPNNSIESPAFALDGSEEPEIVGLYIIDKNGNPKRLGFALGNEFSDHAMEKINYLYLAHSKLRQCAFGPELLLADLPRNITGKSRIRRNNKTIWEKEFLTGEDNMSHNIANLEHHHFKYDLFRQPGDVHIHFFGTSVLSFNDAVETKDKDVFEIEADAFSKLLVTTLKVQTASCKQ